MTEPLYCINHPNVETYLRCARCNAPICAKCAVRTEVGYICPACLHRQQQVFYADFRPIYYLVAAVVAFPLALVGGFVVPATGWLAIFLGPLVGMGIAEAVRWAIRHRRGRHTWLVVAGCVLVGGLPWLLSSLMPLALIFFDSRVLLGTAWGVVWGVVYLIGAVATAAARLRPPRR